MARRIEIEFVKTYATVANAEAAVSRITSTLHGDTADSLRYIVVPVVAGRYCLVAGTRYGVLFIGESAIQAGMHFHFNCVN